MKRFSFLIRRIFVLLLTPIVIFILLGQTKKNVLDTGQLFPDSLSQRLDSLQKVDNLEEWLATSIEYLGDEPAERISFLYATEANAWRKPKNDNERLAWFYLLANQGYYEMHRGNIIRSIDAYEKTYRYYFDSPIPDAEADVLEYLLKPLGNNYTRLGDFDRAFFIQEKGLSLALQLNDSNQVASSYHNLATSARWKNQLSLAEEYCQKGLAYVQKNISLHGLLLSTYSEILLLQKKIKEAETQVRQAIKVLQQNSAADNFDVPNWLRGAYQGYGEILKEKNELRTSLKFYEAAEAIREKYFRNERKREKAKLAVLMGQVLLELKQPEKALEKFNQTLQLLIPFFQLKNTGDLPGASELYAENTILDALTGKAECLLAKGEKEKALDCFMLLFTVERKLRFEFFSSSAKQQQQKENRQWAEAAMETAYDLFLAETNRKKYFAEKMLLIAELSKSQLLLDEMVTNLHYSRLKSDDTLLKKQFQLIQAIALAEKEAILNGEKISSNDNTTTLKKEMQFGLSLIQKEIKEKYPVFSNYLTEENFMSADELLNRIPVATKAIEFFTGDKNIYVLTLTNKSAGEVRRIGNAQDVQRTIMDFVSTWFQNGSAKMMNAPQQYYKEAYDLYRYLFTTDLIGIQERLLIIPDGIIGYLPFDALVTDSFYMSNINDWPFLIKQKSIFFNYSLQTLQQQQAAGGNKNFVGFFISFDSSTKTSIPAVKKEYASLRQVIKGNFFTEKDASISSFQNQLDKTNLLHISTHSFLQGEERIPVLQLADDKFFLFELYGRSFYPQLVVLSACRTGHGMLAEGEGIISLARGFTASGAGGIIAGLWNMHDESTSELMLLFYQQLAKQRNPSLALHAAKLEWLKGEHKQSFNKLPYFWSGLIYAGNDQPVQFTGNDKERSNTIWIISGIILLSATMILFSWKKFRKKLSG